jgi:hypothetical protein
MAKIKGNFIHQDMQVILQPSKSVLTLLHDRKVCIDATKGVFVNDEYIISAQQVHEFDFGIALCEACGIEANDVITLHIQAFSHCLEIYMTVLIGYGKKLDQDVLARWENLEISNDALDDFPWSNYFD